MRLPNVAGTLSDATKLKWSGIDQALTEMLHQAVITDDFADLSNWTEVDSGSNVNLSGGIVTMKSTNSWTTNGLWLTSGVSRATGYMEVKFRTPASIANNAGITLNNTTGLRAIGAIGQYVALFLNSLHFVPYATYAKMMDTAQGVADVVVDTWYTLRLYVGLSADGSTWGYTKFTIQGGAFTNETTMVEMNDLNTTFTSTIYPTLQRYSSDANLISYKEFRWYAGYDTGGPYSEYVHDAGASKIFINFDPSALAMPGIVPSTNLKFAYSFDDGTPSYSGWLTLAELNAEGKQTANRRYIRIRVQNNSDGTTQVYGAKPVSSMATDGIGDFPEVVNVAPDDTVNLVAGTIDLPAISSVLNTDTLRGIAGTFDESARNTDPGIANVLNGIAYKILNASKIGTFDESARNTDPGVANIIKNIAYKILNVAKTGTFDEAIRNVDPGIANVKLATAYKILNIDLTGTLVTGSAPGTPNIGTVTVVSSTALTINFDLTPGAESFKLQRSTDNINFSDVPGAGTITENTYADTGLSAGTRYYYRYSATNEFGTSSYSNSFYGDTTATNQILRNIWTNFKAQMRANSALSTYVTAKYKFNREPDVKFNKHIPFFAAWPGDDPQEETFDAFPKRKEDIFIIKGHMKVKATTADLLEAAYLEANELISNAIGSNLTLTGTGRMADLICSYQPLDKSDGKIGQTNFVLSILTKRYEAGYK